jgi:hypothetical protein
MRSSSQPLIAGPRPARRRAARPIHLPAHWGTLVGPVLRTMLDQAFGPREQAPRRTTQDFRQNRAGHSVRICLANEFPPVQGVNNRGRAPDQRI